MSGARILTCIEPVDVLARLFPTDDLRRRTDVAEELLAVGERAAIHERAPAPM